MVHRAAAVAAARRCRDAGAAEDEPVSRPRAAIPAREVLPVLVNDGRRAAADGPLVEPGAGTRIAAADHARSVLAIACAATHADDHAHWKLKPPIRPSTSSISPIRYRPGQGRDSIVAGSTSDSGVPPPGTPP